MRQTLRILLVLLPVLAGAAACGAAIPTGAPPAYGDGRDFSGGA